MLYYADIFRGMVSKESEKIRRCYLQQGIGAASAIPTGRWNLNAEYSDEQAQEKLDKLNEEREANRPSRHSSDMIWYVTIKDKSRLSAQDLSTPISRNKFKYMNCAF